MQASDKGEFAKVILGFAELKGKNLSSVGVEMFWSAMQDWDIEDFKVAANQLLRTCEFFPTPKDFQDLRKASRMTSGEAWSKVLAYVRDGYSHWDCGAPTLNEGFPAIDDPVIAAAVRAIGGYKAIAMSRTDQTPFLERRFAEHYESISEREDVRDAVPQLAGPSRHGPTSIDKLLEQMS